MKKKILYICFGQVYSARERKQFQILGNGLGHLKNQIRIENWSSKTSIWKTEVLDVKDNLTNVIARLRSCSRCFEIDGASAPYMCDSEVLL